MQVLVHRAGKEIALNIDDAHRFSFQAGDVISLIDQQNIQCAIQGNNLVVTAGSAETVLTNLGFLLMNADIQLYTNGIFFTPDTEVSAEIADMQSAVPDTPTWSDTADTNNRDQLSQVLKQIETEAPASGPQDGAPGGGSAHTQAGGLAQAGLGNGIGSDMAISFGAFGTFLSGSGGAAPNTVTVAPASAGQATSTIAGTDTLRPVDTVAPSAPVIGAIIIDHNIAAITGATGMNVAMYNNNKPSFSGTAEANSVVRLFDGGTQIGAAFADSAGAWTIMPINALADGLHNIVATAADAAGNVSTLSNLFSFNVDTVAPTSATIDHVAYMAFSDLTLTLTDLANGDSIGRADLYFLGSAEAGSRVDLYNGAQLIGSTTADANGTWRFIPDPPLDENAYSITVRATDAAGNTSDAGNTFAFAIDATAPDAPTILSLNDDLAPNIGTVTNHGATNDNQPTFNGTAEAGSTVTFFDGAVQIGQTVADSDGTWSFTPALRFSVGSHSITAIASDLAGNVSAASDALDFTLVNQQISFAQIAQGIDGFVINGEAVGDQAGYSVSAAGDVNGDGLTDLIVGAPLNDAAGNMAGRSYVVFGKMDNTSVNLVDIANGIGGFAITGQAAGDQAGMAVSAAGDVNGDGLADLIVGARFNGAAGNYAGCSYVVFGKEDTTAVDLNDIANGNGGFAITGQSAFSFSGISVATAGDVNGDGLSDLIVGAIMQGGTAGRSYVVFGKQDSTTVNLADVANGNGGFAINGQNANDFSGYAVSAAGDVNGDGLADVLIGSPGAFPGGPPSSTSTGNSYVVFGKTDGSPVDLSAVAAGNGGFVIHGETANDWSGVSVSAAGDVNGDGLADVIVASLAHSAFNERSYVVFGKTDTTAVDLHAIAQGQGGGFIINGHPAGDQAGWSVSSAGDLNGDGLTDLIVGVSANGVPGRSSYVVFGKTDTDAVDLSNVAQGVGGFAINAEAPTDNPSTVSAAGDVNGDGLADLIIGVPQNDTAGDNTGRSYVIFGRADGAFAETAVDQMGTSSDDTLQGSTTSETMVGGNGDDTLTGNGGADVLYGGAGNDTFALNASNIAALSTSGLIDGNFARVDGGSGFDTLRLDDQGSDLILDLTQIANQMANNSRLTSIESIDLNGSGNTHNTLIISIGDVLDMSNAIVDGQHQLIINGNANDSVTLNTGPGGWQEAGTVSQNDHTYTVFNNIADATGGGGAQVLVDAAVQVINNDPPPHVVI